MATHADLPGGAQLALTGNTPEECQAVAQAVHRAARDADDERDLLEVLGLIHVPPHPLTGKKKRTPRPTTTTVDAPINTRQEVNP